MTNEERDAAYERLKARRLARANEKGRNAYIKSLAVEIGTIDDIEYWVVSAKTTLGGLNGYVYFPEKPVKEPEYDGILTYIPVHGGITYAQHDEIGSVYGFDTAHHNSKDFRIHDKTWIKEQCELMIRAIRLAATLEDEYLSAEGDNDKRAEICQRLIDLSPNNMMNFGVSINLLSGKL